MARTGGALTGQVALVTGASSGIGRAAARRLAAAGASLVLTARRQDRLEQVAAELSPSGERPLTIVGDLTDETFRESLVRAALDHHGRIDLLINNAGYGQPGTVEDLPPERLRDQFEINFFAAADLMRWVIPVMRRQGSGRIINVSSTGGRLAAPGLGAYCATKHALEALSDAARLELAPHGVQVSVIAPGGAKTGIWEVGRAAGAGIADDPGSPYATIYDGLTRAGVQAETAGIEADDIAREILAAATAARPRARRGLPLSSRLGVAVAALPAPARDALVRRALGLRGRG